MDFIGDVIGWLFHPDLEPLLTRGAPIFILVITLIVFAESGLLFGIFLPGDSLLFSAGLVVALAGRPSLGLLIGCVFVGAVLGDQVGYIFGNKVGPAIFKRPNSRFFKQENVVKTHAFFEKHGPKALILARFIPIIRTLTPILAGVSHMRYRTFVTFNVVGGAIWSVGGIMLGYGLGRRFPQLEQYLTPVILVIILLSLTPIALEYRKTKRQVRTGT
ncbi:MAG TPA: VTT domain-containing protein [Actinomycetota bacterium]|nr:VTT domain-containing protein [Actinomycetota bacterium]